MQTVLITGGAGYLGTALTQLLLKRSYQVIVYDNLLYGQEGLIPFCHYPNFQFVYGDIQDTNHFIHYIKKADIIIPLAAIVGAKACQQNEKLSWEVNYNQLNLLHKYYNSHVKYVFPNTNSAYGTQASVCTEESPSNPLSIYARHKCAAEDIVINQLHGISLRLATVFGCFTSRLRLDLLINDLVYRACRDGYLALYEQDYHRNFVHVRDVAKAFLFMITHYEQVQQQIYNLGLSNTNLTKYEVARLIKRFIPNLEIVTCEHIQDPDKRDYIISNDKIEKLGWQARIPLEQGIQEMIKASIILLNCNKVHNN